METKRCFKCGRVKKLGEFYRHTQMADGHINKCKECARLDVQANRRSKIEYYREYARQRGSRQTNQSQRKYRSEKQMAAKARRKVAYHVRQGNMTPKPCEVCGKREGAHAHHDDYKRPLNVRWLCPAHHKEWHDNNGEGKTP